MEQIKDISALKGKEIIDCFSGEAYKEYLVLVFKDETFAVLKSQGDYDYGEYSVFVEDKDFSEFSDNWQYGKSDNLIKARLGLKTVEELNSFNADEEVKQETARKERAKKERAAYHPVGLRFTNLSTEGLILGDEMSDE